MAFNYIASYFSMKVQELRVGGAINKSTSNEGNDGSLNLNDDEEPDVHSEGAVHKNTSNEEDESYSYSESEYEDAGELKGHVLVFINYEFPGTKLKTLKRGDDIKEIETLFTEQKYKVEGYYNQTKSQILKTVTSYASKANSGQLICFLSSHGDATSLACYAPDEHDERTVNIIDILRAADTKERENCPKIFFIDACRSDPKRDIDAKEIPDVPAGKFVVGFSCLNLTSSQVGAKSCGVYIETLIKVFKNGFRRKRQEHGKVRDLHHFHKKVQHIFNKEQNKNPNNGKKTAQIPVLKSSIAGHVFLHIDDE